VVAELGPNVDQSRFAPNGLKVGDRVLVRRYSGSWLKIAQGNDSLSGGDENNRLITEAEDILAVPSDD
jgi:co-chaperonin GroES (HSP10)